MHAKSCVTWYVRAHLSEYASIHVTVCKYVSVCTCVRVNMCAQCVIVCCVRLWLHASVCACVWMGVLGMTAPVHIRLGLPQELLSKLPSGRTFWRNNAFESSPKEGLEGGWGYMFSAVSRRDCAPGTHSVSFLDKASFTCCLLFSASLPHCLTGIF